MATTAQRSTSWSLASTIVRTSEAGSGSSTLNRIVPFPARKGSSSSPHAWRTASLAGKSCSASCMRHTTRGIGPCTRSRQARRPRSSAGALPEPSGPRLAGRPGTPRRSSASPRGSSYRAGRSGRSSSSKSICVERSNAWMQRSTMSTDPTGSMPMAVSAASTRPCTPSRSVFAMSFDLGDRRPLPVTIDSRRLVATYTGRFQRFACRTIVFWSRGRARTAPPATGRRGRSGRRRPRR